MPCPNVETLTAATVAAVARENAGHPLVPERAEAYAKIMENSLKQLDSLRSLPLKQIEPATVLQLIETKAR